MPSRDPKDLHPAMQEFWSVLQRLSKDELGIDIFLTCTHRDNAEQERLYAQGRSTQGMIVTNARAGQSPHNTLPSNALDFAVMGADGQLDWSVENFIRVAQIARRLGADPGAFWRGFRDNPHIQMPDWKIGKAYPSSYRFMRVSSAPKPAPLPVVKKLRVRVFDALTNVQIGMGTLISSGSSSKVYIMPQETGKADAPQSRNKTKKIRAFSAKTNDYLGKVTLIGDKVYLTQEQTGGL